MTDLMSETLILRVDPVNPDREIITRAAAVLKSGGLVAFPTETVYGIGANYLDKAAVQRLYNVKGRSRDKPFSIHVGNLEILDSLGVSLSGDVKRLVDSFWPGPLTLVVSRSGRRKIGLRMPSNRVALEVIVNSGVPVVMPSANPTGLPPATNADQTAKYFMGKIEVIIDGGPAQLGMESTVLDTTVVPPVILRRGAIRQEAIASIVGEVAGIPCE
jgi:L-threonylcarbamoyladenylate synthase